MALRASELALLAPLWHREMAGGRVRGVRDLVGVPGFVIEVRTPGRNHLLRIGLTPNDAAVWRIPEPLPAPQQPSAWVMYLRAHLEGCSLDAVEALAGERILRLDFRGPTGRQSIVVYLFGPGPAAGFVSDDGRVLLRTAGAIGDGTLRPGELWQPPPAREGVTLRPPREGWPADAAEAERWLAAWAPASPTIAPDERRTQLLREIDDALRVRQRRIASIQRDMARTDEAPALRRTAELLQTVRHQVPRGATEARVADWYQEGAPEVVIPLDPATALPVWIEKLYHTARRYERSLDTILGRLDMTERECRALGQLRDEVVAAATPEALDRIAGSPLLTRMRRNPPAGGGATAAARQPWHSFEATDGTAIFVGRGARDNDHLTFRHARGNDLWLHALDWAGSHVVVRASRQGTVSHVALVEAALLAAWFSKGRQDGVVAVQYTQRKHVRKPPGAAPGRVSVAGAKAIDVRMDDPRLPRLLGHTTSDLTGDAGSDA